MLKPKTMTTQPRWRSSAYLDRIAVRDHWRVCGMHPPDRKPLWTCPICGEERFSVLSCWFSPKHLWEEHGVPGKFEFHGSKTTFYGPQGEEGELIRKEKLSKASKKQIQVQGNVEEPFIYGPKQKEKDLMGKDQSEVPSLKKYLLGIAAYWLLVLLVI